MLNNDGLLSLNVDTGAWQWDIKSIKARSITDNVVELLSQKITTLPTETQQVLKLAAAVGREIKNDRGAG